MMAAVPALLVDDVDFALAGGFPETYRAARPFPSADAGSLRARTVESLGMISVSSVYSIFLVSIVVQSAARRSGLTFF